MCSFQVKCWSTCRPTPKNLVELTLVIGIPLMDNLNESSKGPIFLWDLNSMKFVLSRLRVSLLAENQSAASVSSVFMTSVRVCKELREKKRWCRLQIK